MKIYFLPMLLSLFFLGACDKNDEIIPEDADENFITSVVMTVDGKSYTADITDNTVTITVPYTVSLNNAEVEFKYTTSATIIPDPETVTDWDNERTFRVTSYNGDAREYTYKVVKSEIESDGDVELKTTEEVASFAATKTTVVKGNLIIGSDAEEAEKITDISALASLKEMCIRDSRGTGGDDLCAGARGDGRGGDRRDARGQCPDDGHLQPRVQHGDRARGTRCPVVCRDGGVFLHADTGTYRAAADHALRGCAVLPFRAARGGEMDREPQSDFVLHVARVAGGDHRPYDGLYPRFARCFARNRTVAGIRGAGDLPGAVQGGAHAGTPLRRRPGGRAVARTEKHGAGRMDVAVVPRPDLLDRPDGIYCMAEFREQLSDLQKG